MATYVKIRNPREGDRTTRFEYQRAVPIDLQPAVGLKVWSEYLPASTKREAERMARPFADRDDTFIRILRTMAPDERAAFVANGGLRGLRDRVKLYSGAIADLPPIMQLLGPMFGAAAPEPEVTPPLPPHVQAILDAPGGDNGYAVRYAIAEFRDRAERELPRLQGLVAKLEGKPVAIGNTMLDLFDLWRRIKGPKIIQNHKATAQRFVAVCGDIAVRDVTRAHVRKFYDQNAQEGLGYPAQTKHRDRLKALFSVALSEGWIEHKPTEGIAIPAPAVATGKDEVARSFAPEQLRLILAQAETSWRSTDLLLALRVLVYTGARGGEVCQLRSEDVAVVDGVPCIRIREAHSLQSIKNAPSRRIVPLHPAIASDVLARAADGQEWLFPSFPHERRRGHARKLQDAFNGAEGLLQELGIEGLTLHNIRHTWIDACRAAGMSEDMNRRLVGHGQPDVHGRYGRGAGLEAMAKALAAVDPLKS